MISVFVKRQNGYNKTNGSSVKITLMRLFHTALCAAGVTKSLFIAEPNKIWLAIPPALKCLRNEENVKNMLESIFSHGDLFLSENKSP